MKRSARARRSSSEPDGDSSEPDGVSSGAGRSRRRTAAGERKSDFSAALAPGAEGASAAEKSDWSSPAEVGVWRTNGLRRAENGEVGRRIAAVGRSAEWNGTTRVDLRCEPRVRVVTKYTFLRAQVNLLICHAFDAGYQEHGTAFSHNAMKNISSVSYESSAHFMCTRHSSMQF